LPQLSLSNLLKDFRDSRNIEIVPIVCQIEKIPGSVAVGLSKPVRDAVPKMGEFVMEKLLYTK